MHTRAHTNTLKDLLHSANQHRHDAPVGTTLTVWSWRGGRRLTLLELPTKPLERLDKVRAPGGLAACHW
eukprot:6479252-Amphidinium_carterae.4